MAITLAVPGNYAAWYTYNNNNLNLLDNIEVEDLLDVQITSPQGGDVLLWDSSLSKWINVDFYATTSTTTTSTTSTTTTSTTSTTTTSTTSTTTTSTTSTTTTSTTSTTGTTVTFTGSTTTSTSTTSTSTTSTSTTSTTTSSTTSTSTSTTSTSTTSTSTTSTTSTSTTSTTSTSTTSTSTTSTTSTSTTSTTGSTTTTTADWSVLDLSPSLWLDGSDSDTFTLDISDNVEQWDDKSGNDNHATQTTSGDRPDKVTNAIDIAAGEFLTVPNFPVAETSHNFFFIGACDAVLDAASIWGADNNSFIPIITTSTSTNLLRFNGTNDPVGAEILINGEETESVTNRTSLKTAIMGAGQILLVVTNVTRFTSASGQELGQGNGGTGTPPYIWVGEVNEVIAIAGDLSLANRQRVEGYLANKWGLGKSLPVGHPYAPTTTTTTTTTSTTTTTTV